MTPPTPVNWPAGVALIGQTGVVLFFVISGYLVGGMWVSPHRTRPAWRGYAARRVARIWPAYALAFTATVRYGCCRPPGRADRRR